jgi:hypothetical protein
MIQILVQLLEKYSIPACVVGAKQKIEAADGQINM